jgi:N-methylhydantoinase B
MAAHGTAGVDRVTFEIIRHKLYQVIDESIIALENVSGSPITNEGHDMMVSLYRADGSLMVGGVGFLQHLTSAAQAVKHIIANFGEDPGIGEDDVYFFNDSYSGALHPPDVYMISPIYHRGELTGFVANFVHVTDIGAIDPSGFSPNARESYQEGFQTQGLKIVEGGRVRRDVIGTFLNMVRDPGMTWLDLKSQLAANHVAKQRMGRLYDDYGVGAVDAVADALIKQSDALLRERLQELPDGVWHAREYLDMPEVTATIQLTATKEGDTLTYDFTGSSPQLAVGVNCSYWATWGAMLAPVFPLLAWDMTWNEGVTAPIRLIAPEGTVINAIRPAPISIATVGAVQVVNNVSTLVISKMLGASSKYADRATAVWLGSHAPVFLNGVNADGEFYIAPVTDTFAGAGGARASGDGVDLGGEIANVVSRWANVETQELNAPVRYLFRRVVPDSGGPGKYRGGVSHEYAFTPHETGGNPVDTVLLGKGTRAPMSLGLFGGLPGCNVAFTTYRDANLAQAPASAAEMRAQEADKSSWGRRELGERDVHFARVMGGGGYGDPIDRDPDAVLEDVVAGTVSAAAAGQIYGVIVDVETVTIDLAATGERRRNIRSERLGHPIAPEFAVRRDVAVTHRRLGEYLQDVDEGVQCVWCGHVFSRAAHWKDQARSIKTPPSWAGPDRDDGEEFSLAVFCCPSCATLLDVDVTHGESEPLRDHVRSWPEG